MLGQLLHSINPVRRSSSGRTPPLIDSVAEDDHTRALIFPGNDLLHHQDGAGRPFPTPDFDNAARNTPASDSTSADIDLEFPRDIRILIAQGESSSLQELLLFDSKPGIAPESPTAKQARLARGDTPPQNFARLYGRAPTVSAIPEDAERQRANLFGGGGSGSSAFAQRSRVRKTSVSSLPDEPTSPRQKEVDEIVKVALDCMFENASSSYKGTSNKIHIVPLESKPYDSAICSTSLTNDFASPLLGKSVSSLPRRPSSLAKSYTPGDQFLQKPRTVISPLLNSNRRRTVLITRTFSVSWSEEEELTDDLFAMQLNGKLAAFEEQQAVTPMQTGFTHEPRSPARSSRSRTYRSPMYAITAVLQLPVSSGDSPAPSHYGPAASRRLGSHTSLGSSWESERRSGWTLVDPMFGMDSLASHSITSDVDDRVDLIGQHWDIISRTLTTLQYLVQKKILELLRPLPKLRRGIKLLHMALSVDSDIRKAAEDACFRILRGIKIQRVISGQGRWGIWREEARWLGHWAGGRDENFFFFNLITAFLGTHTEWLNVLAPRSYRERHREQQRLGPAEDLSVPSRTVIVSADKMAARRLIFLLSSFLPASHQSGARGDSSPLRPSTAASIRAYSQSPPTHAPISRQESLRRTINRRGQAARSRTRHHVSRGSNASSIFDMSDDRTETGTIRGADGEVRTRRPSEARSIIKRSLTMTEADGSDRKSSATTSSTLTPSPAMPVPHFAYNRQASFGAMPALHRRPGSRDSIASVNLMNTLQRHNSSDSGSKWGSLKSLWSMGSRRQSSTEFGDVLQTTDEGLGIMGVRQPDQLRSQLQQMVDEGEQLGYDRRGGLDDRGRTPEQADMVPVEFAMLSPDRTDPISKPIDLPIKTSVNPEDGVIDVQIPFHGWGSPLQSPPIAGYTSGSSWGESSFHSSIMFQTPRESEHPLNVAGWLDKLHPDFALQAIKPYPDVVKDVKAAMRAEPNPPSLSLLSEETQTEKWIDVCTTLVADTSNFTVKRLRLRRLVKIVKQPQNLYTPRQPYSPTARPQYINPYMQAQLTAAPITSEMILEEKFDEEKIMDFDGALVDAIEHLLSQSGSSSKTQSQASSRSSSRRGRSAREPQTGSRRGSEDHLQSEATAATEQQEISRHECKRFILGALEQIAKNVSRERREAVAAARATGAAAGGSEQQQAPLQRLRSLDEPDSTLREGIVRWFEGIERNRVIELARDQPESVQTAAAVLTPVYGPNSPLPRPPSSPAAPAATVASPTTKQSVLDDVFTSDPQASAPVVD